MKKIAILFMFLVLGAALMGCAQKRNQAPIIQGVDHDVQINVGDEYNPLDGVIATDEEDGNITSQIQRIGDYDVNEVNTFTIKLKVTDKGGLSDEETITLNVVDPTSNNQKPQLIGVVENQTYFIGYDEIDPIAGVTALDAEDGVITNIQLTVPTTPANYLEVPGVYQLIVKVTDSVGHSTQKTIFLTVKHPTVPNELTTDLITITFWHAFGQDKEALLQEYANEFMALYPNVTITLASQGGYDDLLSKVTSSIVAKQEPTMLIGYPDHVVSYLSANAVEPLDQYVTNPYHGLDIEDFIESYITENKSYDNAGTLYGLPFNKSTEVLIYNKTWFTQNNQQVPTTWDEVEAISKIVKQQYAATDVYGFSYDSAANMFITLTKQWGGDYTSIDATGKGVLLFDNPETRAMMQYFVGLDSQNLATLPGTWEQDYASIPFVNNKVFMTVGSTAGIKYNVPNANPDGTLPFEIGVAKIPQKNLNNQYVIQQGTNISIMKSASAQEKLAAWLFTKYLTSTDVTARWAMATGYLPVRESAYESAQYQQFLTNPTDAQKYTSMAANAAYLQRDYMFVDQPFIGSSKVRAQVDLLLNTVIVGNISIDEAIANALRELQE